MVSSSHLTEARPEGIRPESARRIRVQGGLTQTAIAARAGISPKTVMRWEAGQVTPSELAWARYERALLRLLAEAAA
jgi:DNA-binding transcriptional regulator YiaG